MAPEDLARDLGARARALRLQRNQSQAGLAAAAGVSLAAVKRFEGSGQIALVALVRLALALGATAELESWFSPPEVQSIDEALSRKKRRQRGRRG